MLKEKKNEKDEKKNDENENKVVKEGKPTKKLCEPNGLVVVLHGDGAGVQEDQHDHEPEPGRSLETDVVARTFIVDVHLTSLAD